MAKTVLVVDDAASARWVLAAALRGAGYDVIDAENGRDALTKIARRKIHLVICDVNMPVMNGAEFLQEIKKSPEHKFVPVLMLTTETAEEKRLAAKVSGARGWMIKPFVPSKLLEAVAKVCLP